MAEKLVSAANLPRGTFLVRRRDIENEYALTINDSENTRLYGFNVKHYKIKPLDGNVGFYITTRKIFPTIKDLIRFYSGKIDGKLANVTFFYRSIRRSLLQIDISGAEDCANATGFEL